MSKPQPIGIGRKGKKDAVEQVSFRLPASKKRQFAALLAERGVEMKEVLVEFIEYYIKYRGKIGVVEILDNDYDAPGSSSRRAP